MPTSRDRVLIQRLAAFLARERQNVFVEMKEIENHMLSSINTEVRVIVSISPECVLL